MIETVPLLAQRYRRWKWTTHLPVLSRYFHLGTLECLVADFPAPPTSALATRLTSLPIPMAPLAKSFPFALLPARSVHFSNPPLAALYARAPRVLCARSARDPRPARGPSAPRPGGPRRCAPKISLSATGRGREYFDLSQTSDFRENLVIFLGYSGRSFPTRVIVAQR